LLVAKLEKGDEAPLFVPALAAANGLVADAADANGLVADAADANGFEDADFTAAMKGFGLELICEGPPKAGDWFPILEAAPKAGLLPNAGVPKAGLVPSPGAPNVAPPPGPEAGAAPGVLGLPKLEPLVGAEGLPNAGFPKPVFPEGADGAPNVGADLALANAEP
jgi:hypothetical protein